MVKDRSKSEKNSTAFKKKLLESVLNKMNVPSTSKPSNSSSEEESSFEEEEVKPKNAHPQPVRNNTFQFNKQLLQTANLTARKDYLKQIIADSNMGPIKSHSKVTSSNKGILKKSKKLETISDSESDRSSGKSLFPATETSNLNESNSDDDFSDKNFNAKPLATSTQKEAPEEVFESVERQGVSKSKNKKIKIIEDISVKPTCSYTEEETIEDDETETDVVLSSLQCLYPDEHFTKLTKKCMLKDDTDDADVFLIHIPKTLDPKLLIGCTISTRKETKLNVNGEEFVIQVSREETKPLSIIDKLKNHRYGCKTLKPVANMLVHHELKSNVQTEPLAVVNNTIEFPEELKTRHPLFGVDYSDKITIDDETQKKLNKAVSDHLKKKKKKKKSKETKQNDDGDDEMVFKLLGDSASNRNKNAVDYNDGDDYKKQKKHKRENSIEMKTPTKVMHSTMLATLENTPVFNPNEDQSSTEEHIKKKKKKKHEKEDHQDLIMKLLEKYANNTMDADTTSKRKHKHDDDTGKKEKKKKKKVDTTHN